MRFSFSGHETFPLRLHWLKKAVDLVKADPLILNKDEAIAMFGVGKNMVRAIKHWGLTLEILEPHPQLQARGALTVSALGEFLMGDEGVDPYCEDLATLWLLHWKLCESPYRATLWHYVFGYWRGGPLELEPLAFVLERWLAERGGKLPSIGTLRRDLQCLENTYLMSAHKEEIIGYSLEPLNLLQRVSGIVYLNEYGYKNLAPEIFAYAVLDYWDKHFSEMSTLPLYEVLAQPASPGKMFLLREEELFELIEQIETFEDAPFRYDNTAGLQQLYRSSRCTAWDMLRRYYARFDVNKTIC